MSKESLEFVHKPCNEIIKKVEQLEEKYGVGETYLALRLATLIIRDTIIIEHPELSDKTIRLEAILDIFYEQFKNEVPDRGLKKEK